MKYTCFILTLSLFLSCDKEVNMTYILDNNTKDDLCIIFLSSEYQSDSICISHYSREIWLADTDKGSPSKVELEILYDSILIKRDNNVITTYKPTNLGKNIFDYQYWNEKKRKRRDYEYTYTITNDDINL